MKEELPPAPEEEGKIYKKELGERKNADIFAQPSSAEFLSMLKPECDDPTTEGQAETEKMFVEKGITNIVNHFRTRFQQDLTSHWRQSQESRLAFQNQNPEVVLKQVKNMNQLWMDLLRWTSAASTRHLVSMANISENQISMH